MPARLVIFAIVFLGWTVQVGHGQSTASLLVNGSFEQGPAVEQFLKTNETAEGRQKNRRVEVRVQK
jgi:hypothetical protein